VLVKEGQHVKKGDTLLMLERAPLEDKLSRAKADLAIAALDVKYLPDIHAAKETELQETLKRSQTQLAIVESRLQRYRSLRSESAASAEEISDVEEIYATRSWEMKSAEQQLKKQQLDSAKKLEGARQTLAIRETAVREAERDLTYCTIASPCDGLVTRVASQPGELLLQEVTALMLADDIVFKAYIDQTRVNTVQPGDVATVRLIAHPGKQFKGSVVQVNPSIDTRGVVAERGRIDTRFTYSAWIKLEGVSLPPGLQGHVEIRKEVAKPAVPESAVIHLSGGEGMALVLREGRANVTKVELGPTRGPWREVRSGVEAGDQIVLYPLGLKADDQLRPITREDGPQVASRR
jgi:HlyD family secretion protein